MAIVLCVCAVFLVFYVRKISGYCKNPYTLRLIVGSKGSGKSLLLSKICNEFDGPIYSNMGIGYELPPDYWNHSFPQGSLIVIDEIGVIHSNRDFKSMPYQCIEWYKMQRKNRLTVVCSSQTMDVDKKIRDLCDRIIVVNRYNFICVARAYVAKISIVQTPEGGHDLVNDIKLKGVYSIYTIPKTVQTTEKLGYKTEQLITKNIMPKEKKHATIDEAGRVSKI